ncbi:Zonular occludens toxin, partial [Xylella fastidiosa subsp. multiplex]|nr:Zonular occludens toxin [Xylella fastidiosa subsp. multiplex]MDD0866603.1 Zonular occludens toxin [Xylella fastidiosa subsp. multiplex]MDD0875610.1 Zonular occludens toxin [Xylella fastidiosa subsp. multiplex]MDD0877756.1 Zonular occludens toxin [Xylella fastidiosa subsp. multiplex]MDD0879906.1 Zonular occludens toxin [Xylella fastidiosa subsp. multiplex]
PGQVVSGAVHQDVSAPVVPPVDPLSDLGPEQRYIFDLSAKGRLRLAALAQVGHEYRAWVQWINTENLVIEQLDLEQLRALGFDVSVHSYGVRISVLSHVLVATAWPWREPVRETDPRLYNLSRDQQGAVSIASAASDAHGEPAVQGGVIEKGERAMGTFPESPGYEHHDESGGGSLFSR